jgi:hypothetical protein
VNDDQLAASCRAYDPAGYRRHRFPALQQFAADLQHSQRRGSRRWFSTMVRHGGSPTVRHDGSTRVRHGGSTRVRRDGSMAILHDR